MFTVSNMTDVRLSAGKSDLLLDTGLMCSVCTLADITAALRVSGFDGDRELSN